MDKILHQLSAASDLDAALAAVVADFSADSGTIHLIEADGLLHLHAASRGIPQPVLETIRVIPIGKGMAGFAAQRQEPVTVCNLQTDDSGDVRPGAKATGLEGAIVVPIFDESDRVVGTLGVANRQARTFTAEETQRLIECGRRLSKWVL